MSFTDVFIKRPVFATTLALIILLVGLVSLSQLTLRLFPNISPSVISVTTSYPGADANLIEGFVTTPIENAISSIDGIDYIESKSTPSRSRITVHMKLGYDINDAMTDVASKVSSVRWQLPKDIYDPTVEKSDPNAQPIIYLSFLSNTKTPEQVTDYLLRVVQPQLQTLDGVSQAELMGQREYAMRIWLNPQFMAAHNVTASDVQQALLSNNIQSASGLIEGEDQEFTVYSNTDLNNEKQFNNIPIRTDSTGHTIRIKDVGKAELGAPDDRVTVLMNGIPSIFIGIIPKSTANPFSVARETLNMLPTIQKYMPKGIKATLLGDMSTYIASSLREVRGTILEACFFVFLVIFLMIGSFRAVLIPMVTIPLSVIGSAIFMHVLGYSINTMTLLAFVLAIGLVVDDAIVVLENIHRHLAEGLPPVKAAIVGAREISFAVITMTLTLAAVYAPIGFTTGLTGKLFSEFAFTLAGAVIVSGFLALTLTPMMCSKIYRKNENFEKGMPGAINRIFVHIMAGYKKLLLRVIKAKYIVLIVALSIVALCGYLYLQIPSELIPSEDQGAIIGIVAGSGSANLSYTERQTELLAKIYDGIPEIENYGIINGVPNGVSSALSFVILKDWDKRKRSADQIINSLYMPMMMIPGVQAFPVNPPLLPGAGGMTPIDFVLKTTKSYEYLNKESWKFVAALKKWGGLRNIQNDLQIDQPQTIIDIHRNEAADLGIQMSAISASLGMFLGQPEVTRFNIEGRSYQVLPELFPQFRKTPDSLYDLNVRTSSGKLVPLSNLVTVKEKVIPRTLNHFQQLRSAIIKANLTPGMTQGNALSYMTKLANKTLPKDIQIDYTGQSRQYEKSSGKMMQTFIFAIIFIYLILAAQFESFIDPFIVMFSVPLSIAGALLLLLLDHGTMNIYTQIGLVTLVGLITKNGILIVEFANQLQEKGVEFSEAIITSAAVRLRPILMTTGAMVLGSLPLVMASGAGANARHQMGLVIIGGMTFGTLLTLFIIPTAYYYFASKKEKTEEE